MCCAQNSNFLLCINTCNSRYANDPDVAGIMQTLSQAKANIIPPASVAESASFSIGGSSGGGGLPIRLETKGLRQRKPAQEEALLAPPTEIVDSDYEPTTTAAFHRRRQHMASKKAVEESSHFKHEELEEEFGDGNVVTSHSPFWATPAQAIASALGGLGAKSKHHSSSNEGGGDANIQGGVSQILADVLGLGGSSGSKNANADGAEDNDDNEVVANLASFPPRSGSAYDMMMQVRLYLLFAIPTTNLHFYRKRIPEHASTLDVAVVLCNCQVRVRAAVDVLAILAHSFISSLTFLILFSVSLLINHLCVNTFSPCCLFLCCLPIIGQSAGWCCSGRNCVERIRSRFIPWWQFRRHTTSCCGECEMVV